MSIKISSVTSTYPLAEVLSEQGYSLSPKQDTPLEDLVKSAYVPYQDGTLQEYAELVNKSTTYPLKTVEDKIVPVSLEELVDNNLQTIHSKLMGETADAITEHVKRHLNFARNTIKPLVNELNEKITNELSAYKVNLNPEQQFNIIALSLPEIVNDIEFMDNFNRYEDKVYSFNDTDALTITLKEGTNVAELINTLIKDSSVEVNDFINGTLDTAKKEKIFNTFFWYNRDQPWLREEDLRYLNAYEKLDLGIFLYVIAKAIKNNPPEDITKYQYKGQTIGLAELEKVCTFLMDYAGGLVSSNYSRIHALINTGVLVLSVDPKDKAIYVSNELYKQWLNNPENSPEVLFGLIVSDMNLSLVSQIDAEKDTLVRAYKQYCTMFEATQYNETLNILKTLLVSTFSQFHKNNQEETLMQYRDRNADEYDKVLKYKLTDFTESLTIKDIEDVFLLALKLVAECEYYFTSAYSILFTMYNLMRQNEKLSANEAALISAIEYVGVYLGGQIVRTV